MTAEDLKVLYETELREELDDLRRPYDERMGLWGLLCESRRTEPGELREEDRADVWVWSDLHLGHAPTIGVFGRPYGTPEEMDDELFGAWWQVVAPGDTIVNLGDLTPGGLSGRRLKRLRAAPGRKILILGNHEFVRGALVGVEGFDEVYSTLYIAGRPELLLTHLPLRVVPRVASTCTGTSTSRFRGELGAST